MPPVAPCSSWATTARACDLGLASRSRSSTRTPSGLLQVAADEWSLVGGDGRSLPLMPSDWRNGNEALALLRELVPAELQVVSDAVDDIHAARLLLLHAPPHRANDALWPARRDAWLLQTPRWTVVVRDQDEESTYADAVALSAALGRRHAVLLLEQVHGELRMVTLHRGKERDRHVWTGDEHDAGVLAELLSVDAEQLQRVLTCSSRPPEAVTEMAGFLEVPEQVAALLSGASPDQVPGLVHTPARGVRESFAAAICGEFDPPDSNAAGTTGSPGGNASGPRRTAW